MAERRGLRLGERIAPPRFLLFMALAAAGVALAVPLLGWREGGMAAFDVAALVFLGSAVPLLSSRPDQMRAATARNDANRALLLLLTAVVSLAVLVAVAAELAAKGAPQPGAVALIVATLAIAWLFANAVYALHYAHIFYIDADGDGKEERGLDFPCTDEPDYWDFLYFAICLGMTFQTSDVEVTQGRVRRVVTAHCLAAFVFNLGIVAFTINVLGGGR